MVLEKEPNYTEQEDQVEQLDDQLEETLSLCDLPIYSSSSGNGSAHGWDIDLSKEEPRSSSYLDDDDLFEFFSEDFTASIRPANKYIIFCGKVIPSKGSTKISDKGNNLKGSDKRVLMPNTHSQIRSTTDYGLPLLRWGKTKSRWYLFMLGRARFKFNSPAEMNLRDIKNRQKRCRLRMMDPLTEDHEVVKKTKKNIRKGEGLWGIITRALACKSKHANAFVETKLA